MKNPGIITFIVTGGLISRRTTSNCQFLLKCLSYFEDDSGQTKQPLALIK